MERTIETPLGLMCLSEAGGKLLSFSWRTGGYERCPVLLEAEKQLSEYFAGNLRSFQLPLAPNGTPFQQEVWNALLSIPYGETRSYATIASLVGKPKAYRAVGMACNRNPLPVFIPCHRIIGTDGLLTGYAGGLERKQILLSLESSAKGFLSASDLS